MNTTLVIIDVQPKFSAAAKIVNNTIHQIKLARRRKDGIILVEYGKQDPSYNSLYKAVYNYDKFALIYKNNDDGSAEVLKAIVDNDFSDKRVRFCGVNICACVWDTVIQFMKHSFIKRVELSADACGCMHLNIDNCLACLEEKINEFK